MGHAARIQRLKVPAHQGSLEPVRQQVRGWLQEQTPSRLGLPADAIVLLRSVRAPWSALRADSQADVLGPRLRHAVRPATGAPMGAGCDAVWFADEAELLACLAHDGLQGQVAHRWWWQTWLGHRTSSEAALQAWLKSARVAPSAMTRLNAMGQGLAWARHIGSGGRLALFQAMQAHHPVATAATAWLAQALSDAPIAADPAVLRASRASRNADDRHTTEALHRTGSLAHAHATPGRSDIDGASVLRALCGVLHEAPHLALDERQLAMRLLPGSGWVDAAPAQASQQGADPTDGAWPIEKAHQRDEASSSSLPSPQQQGEASPSAPTIGKQRSAHDLPPVAAPLGHAPDTGSIPPAEACTAPAPHAAHPAPALTDTRRATRAPTSMPLVRPQVTQTSHGGVFFLLNLALAWELYGDFTRPRHALLSVSPWQFLHAAGIAMLGRSFAADQLAGWLREQTPFCRPRLASAWGQAPMSLLPETEARSLLQPEGGPTTNLPASRPSKRAETELSCWWPLLRRRLSLALNQPERQAVPTCLNLQARVERRGERVDVCFDLHQLPLTVRLAGLDRDPGWVPASGCDVRFQFEA